MSRFAILLSFALAWLAIAAMPESALACSVCYAGAEESRKAFLWTTLLLSVLPLAMLGGLGWWIWRHVRAVETQQPDPQ